MSDQPKPILLSGIQPSGQLCIANYVGAVKNWVELQETTRPIYLVVDMHAITVLQKPAELRQRTLSFAAQYIACGIDPEKSIIALQSHIPQHAELTWVLNTLTSMGELSRMTQFKDKSARHAGNINAGLFTYPVLMAADILIYQTDLVPVGEDQKQHLELTRNLAQRFNHRYSNTFKIPEPFIPKVGARVMSLQDPEKKMSKSDENSSNLVALLDPPKVITNKIKRAVTDSYTEVRYDENRPGLANLLSIFSVLSGQSYEELELHFTGKMYSDLKRELADLIIAKLEPIQSEYQRLIDDKQYLNQILKTGADRARSIAYKTLAKVYRKVGFPAYPK